jgi:hypothetical protein
MVVKLLSLQTTKDMLQVGKVLGPLGLKIKSSTNFKIFHMKLLINIAVSFVSILFAIISCKKEETPTKVNQLPIAKAKPDTSFQLSSCGGTTSVVLDGSGSYDPDGHIVAYSWRQISGPRELAIANPSSSIATAEVISVGEYAFELRVRDGQDLVSEDTIRIRAFASPTEYDLDISFHAMFTFTDNFEDCGWDYDYPCPIYDFTEIKGTGTFPPFGDFNLYVAELADSANLSNVLRDDQLSFYTGYGDKELITGISSVNFKKLIREGGGVFAGSLSLTWGSVNYCDRNVIGNLSPLNITGNLDIATHAVNLTIKGKVYF